MFKKLDSLYLKAQSKIANFASEERGDVNIVSMVVLIGIAVLLAVVFKGSIKNLVTSMLNTISNNATNAIS